MRLTPNPRSRKKKCVGCSVWMKVNYRGFAGDSNSWDAGAIMSNTIHQPLQINLDVSAEG